MNIDKYLEDFCKALDETFGQRVVFCGLQGSRARGEHRDNSDYDMVVILDHLYTADIEVYRDMLSQIQGSELACGFLGGRDELLAWDVPDLITLCFDTRPLKGSLDDISKRIDTKAVRTAVHSGACAVYHGCVHNMIYERSDRTLRSLLKQSKFAIQAAQYVRTGRFEPTFEALWEESNELERPVLRFFGLSRNDRAIPFLEASDALFQWSGDAVRSYAAD